MAHHLQKSLTPLLFTAGLIALVVYLAHIMANYYSADLRIERAKFEKEQEAFWSNVDHTHKVMATHARLQTKPQ